MVGIRRALPLTALCVLLPTSSAPVLPARIRRRGGGGSQSLAARMPGREGGRKGGGGLFFFAYTRLLIRSTQGAAQRGTLMAALPRTGGERRRRIKAWCVCVCVSLYVCATVIQSENVFVIVSM